MLDRGQTEILGFIMVFAIIVSTIGLVYAGGFTGLTDMRDVERVNNAQRAFEVLADNIEDITFRNAPSRATEIKLAAAQLTVADPIEIEVNVTGAKGFSSTYDSLPIVFDADTGTKIVFSQGAVIRQQGDDGIVVHESTLQINDSRTVIPIIQTRLDGDGVVSGSTSVLIRMDSADTTVDYSNVSGDRTVWFNMTTPRATTWYQYLEPKADIDSCSLVSTTVSCKITTDRIYIVAVRIDVSLE